MRRSATVPTPDRAPDASRTARLVAIRTLHTVVWAFFAACIAAIPVFAGLGRLQVATALIAISFVEVLVIALNGGRCPLTAVAARYTSDRRDNFGIYLPEWLARNNKRIFGTIYAAGVLWTMWLWYTHQPT
jgi:hypothetical protein